MTSPPEDHTPANEPEIIPAHLQKRKSGPTTAAGRQAVRHNAVRHGLAARDVCVPGIEDPAEFVAFRDGLVESLAPEGALENALANNIAETLWRLRRVAPAEAEAIAVARERVARDFAQRQPLVRPMYLDEAQRRLEFAREAFEAFAAFLDDPGEATANEVFLSAEAVREFYCAVAGHDASMPGLDVPRTGSALAVVLPEIAITAEKLKVGTDDVEAATLERLERSVEKRQEHLDYLIAEQDRMTRERLLPPEQALTNITRHEAHLNRQLSQYMSQLETLQSRRHGLPTPLARVHFTTGA